MTTPLEQMQARARKQIDTLIYDEHGNQAITPKGRDIVNSLITEVWNEAIKECEGERPAFECNSCSFGEPCDEHKSLLPRADITSND